MGNLFKYDSDAEGNNVDLKKKKKEKHATLCFRNSLGLLTLFIGSKLFSAVLAESAGG